nr:ERCC4 domain-containing protein [uncultured Methanolobus sp.]
MSKIIIDTREKKPFSQCESWSGVAYEVATLKTADYSNGKITIERKAVGDFINCCGRSKARFTKELERGFDYLIIEGGLAEIQSYLRKVRSKMGVYYIFAMMKMIRHKYGIEVIMCRDREAAARVALRLLV